MSWHPVCTRDDLTPGRGVCALVGKEQVAIFLTEGGRLFAIGNEDPFTGVQVMSRGIVGTRGDTPTIASPLHKQVFSLESGQCMDAGQAVPVYRTRVRDGKIEVEMR